MLNTQYKWLGLVALIPSIAMVFIDLAVLPVALPTIRTYFKATTTQLWWCINAYLLVSAVLLLAGGKLGDRIGYRRVFGIGMAVFAFASALCGFSSNIEELISARALQGVGGALIVPASSSLIMSLFSEKERGKAVGINMSISSLFLILGPLIGGYLTENFSWRWIFWINIPLALLGIFLLFCFLPLSSKGKEKIDFLGFIFFLISCASLIILIMQGGVWGWTSFPSILFLALCFLASLFLFWRERDTQHPFLDLSLFHHPVYKAVNISIFAAQFVLMISVYRAIFFQDALGWSPIRSGATAFIGSLPVLFMAPIGGWLADKWGPKVPLAIGFTLLISSFFYLAWIVPHPLWTILLGLFAFSVSISLIFTPSYSSAMNIVPPRKAGTAFGILATTRSLSASLGVAAIGTFTNSMQTYSLHSLIEKGEAHTLPSTYIKESEINSFFIIHILLGIALILVFAFVFALYKKEIKK